MDFAKRVNGPGMPRASAGGMPIFADRDRFPALAEYLGCEVWDDGKPREPATLAIFVQDGVLKCCITDKANLRMGFLTALGLGQLLEALEAALREDRMDWRPWRPFKAKK